MTATLVTSPLSAAYKEQGGALQVFSAKVAAYRQSRPDYPQALLDALGELRGSGRWQSASASPAARLHGQPPLPKATQPDIDPPWQVADVGAGTGLLTRGLLACGWTVTAVEPNLAMLSALRKDLGDDPRLLTVAGQAEAMPLPDASTDLITAAQAFHWFDIDTARAECQRVLRRDGWVALIWNDRLLTDPLHQALDTVFDEVGGAKRGALLAHEDRQHVARFFGQTSLDDAIKRHAGLLRQQSWPHEHWLDAAGLQALAMSRSYMPDADSAAGRAVASRIARIFAAHAHGERVAVRYTTVLIAGHASLLQAAA